MQPEIVSILVNQLPVTVLLGYLWWMERKERKETQKALDDCLQDKDDKLANLHDDQ